MPFPGQQGGDGSLEDFPGARRDPVAVRQGLPPGAPPVTPRRWGGGDAVPTSLKVLPTLHPFVSSVLFFLLFCHSLSKDFFY